MAKTGGPAHYVSAISVKFRKSTKPSDSHALSITEKRISRKLGILTAYVLVVLPAFGMRYWYAMTALFMTGMPSAAVK
jgi:hypothetical protein